MNPVNNSQFNSNQSSTNIACAAHLSAANTAAEAASKEKTKSNLLPIKACKPCGVTDKKLSACGKCHIERYCSQACQIAAWPNHKQVCLISSKSKSENSKDMCDVETWSGKKFGEFKAYCVIEKNIRILSHTKGFAIFLPKDFWRKLDY